MTNEMPNEIPMPGRLYKIYAITGLSKIICDIIIIVDFDRVKMLTIDGPILYLNNLNDHCDRHKYYSFGETHKILWNNQIMTIASACGIPIVFTEIKQK